MFSYFSGKYNLRLLDKSNKDELIQVQKLRYQHLLRDFNPNLPLDGIDDDGHDEMSDSIIVEDVEKHLIVGTYRCSTKKTIGKNRFISEGEFNIDSLKKGDFEILELGRAVVNKDYRDGSVINLLWAGIFEYINQNNCKYIFGTCSLHGVDPLVHSYTLAYLKKNCLFTDFVIQAVKNSFEYPNYLDLSDYSDQESYNNLPPLLKAYLKIGIKVGNNGYIDYDFNSCDCLTISSVDELNPKIDNFYKRHLK